MIQRFTMKKRFEVANPSVTTLVGVTVLHVFRKKYIYINIILWLPMSTEGLDLFPKVFAVEDIKDSSDIGS